MSKVYLVPSVLDESALQTIPTYLIDAVKDCKVIFAEINVADQINIVESLTAEVNKSIMEYIEEIRAFEKKYLSFTKNNKEYNINLDASFFSNE